MAVLHIVCHSPSASLSLQQCLRRIRTGDAILFTGDGVYAAVSGAEAARSLGAALADGVEGYCLCSDLDARGIAALQLVDGLQCLDYGGFVDLAVRFPRSCAW